MSEWQEAEFQTAVDQFMQQPPSLGASAGGSGFTVAMLMRPKADVIHLIIP
jgi:hypothetical protein